MCRIGKCSCGGELLLSPVYRTEIGPQAFCKKCYKEYSVEMKGKSRCYTRIKEESPKKT